MFLNLTDSREFLTKDSTILICLNYGYELYGRVDCPTLMIEKLAFDNNIPYKDIPIFELPFINMILLCIH